MRRRRWSMPAALLALLALLAAACGVRVSPQLRREAANAQLGAGASVGGSGLTAGQGASGTGAGGSAQVGSGTAGLGGGVGVGGAYGTGAGTASSGASGGGSGGSGPAASVPAGGNGGATDVGVTADSILLGNTSDLSGPVPGLFQGAVTGTLAYFNYVNSQGGVFGRQLKLDAVDTQTQCAQAENDITQLLPKVLAFVGSFTLYDDCEAQVFDQHHDVPNVSYVLSGAAVALPNSYSVDPIAPGGYSTGYFNYYKAKFGDAVQRVGTLYPNISSAVSQWNGFQAASQSVGWKVIYQRAAAATETNFTTDIVRMQQAGVRIVFLPAENAQNAATIVQEAQQQNWKPIFIIPVAYANNFVQLVGSASAAEGVLGAQLFSLFFNAQDAQAIPEVALYQTWMKRTNPSQPEDLFSMYGWAESALFVQALKAAGPKLTRSSLLGALSQIHSFSDNGMVGPADPAGKKPTICYVLWQIHNGGFERVDTPAGQYRCDGTFFHG